MKINDRLIGLLAIIGGIAIICGTFGFREIPGQQFGSGFFPRIVGGVVIFVGVVQILIATPAPLVQIGEELRSRDALLKLGVPASVIFWLLTVNSLGFLLTTMIVALVLSVALGARVLPALVTAVGLSAMLYLIFGVLLRVPLPRGMIEVWLA